MRAEPLPVLRGQVRPPQLLQRPVPVGQLGGGERVGRTPTQRQHRGHPDGEGRPGRGGEVGAHLRLELTRHGVEQRHVRAHLRAAGREQAGALGVEALLRGVVDRQGHDQRLHGTTVTVAPVARRSDADGRDGAGWRGERDQRSTDEFPNGGAARGARRPSPTYLQASYDGCGAESSAATRSCTCGLRRSGDVPVDRPPELPDDLPVFERDVVRVVVQDADGAVLLLRAQDRTEPALGTWWELRAAASRPARPWPTRPCASCGKRPASRSRAAQVGAPTWRRTATFRYRGRRHLQHEVVVLVTIGAALPAWRSAGGCPTRPRTTPTSAGGPSPSVLASRERFYPGRLPALLPDLLAGVEVDEPFELFS